VWREDATNLDESRLRAAIRARVVPELERLRPGASIRAGRAAKVMRGAARVVEARAGQLVESGGRGGAQLTWARREMRAEPDVVLGEMIRAAARVLLDGCGADRLTSRGLAPVIRAMKDPEQRPREFRLGGLEVRVTSRVVTIGKASGNKQGQ